MMQCDARMVHVVFVCFKYVSDCYIFGFNCSSTCLHSQQGLVKYELPTLWVPTFLRLTDVCVATKLTGPDLELLVKLPLRSRAKQRQWRQKEWRTVVWLACQL